jgi:transposase
MPRRLKFHVPVRPLGQHLRPRLLAPVVWRPLTDGEWDFVRPFVLSLHGRGRPVREVRARLDACLHGATMVGPWKELPERFGKADTISRQFRRWAEAGLWEVLLHAVVHQGKGAGLGALLYFLCRCFRRAHRVLGLRGLCLARALGMDSALRAPRDWLPDPDLSEHYHATIFRPGSEKLLQWPKAKKLWAISLWEKLLTHVGGRARIAGWMAPA